MYVGMYKFLIKKLYLNKLESESSTFILGIGLVSGKLHFKLYMLSLFSNLVPVYT